MHLRLERGAPISQQDGFNSCIRPSEWALVHLKEALVWKKETEKG